MRFSWNRDMYQGVYINLDSSSERRDVLVAHLENLGLAARYHRFPAIDGRTIASEGAPGLQPGALGCWMSHTGVLEAHRGSPVHLHVIEDDIVLAHTALTRFDELLRQADDRLGGWDVLYTEVHLPIDAGVHRLFLERVRICEQTGVPSFVDLAEIAFAGMTSYFVNRRSRAKVCDLLAGAWACGAPIDLFIRHLVHQSRLRAFVTVPFLTTLSAAGIHSDIRGRVDRSRRVCEAYRRAFFIDADRPALMAEMQELVAGAKVAPLSELFLEAQRFSLSDSWEVF